MFQRSCVPDVSRETRQRRSLDCWNLGALPADVVWVCLQCTAAAAGQRAVELCVVMRPRVHNMFHVKHARSAHHADAYASENRNAGGIADQCGNSLVCNRAQHGKEIGLDRTCQWVSGLLCVRLTVSLHAEKHPLKAVESCGELGQSRDPVWVAVNATRRA